MLLIKVANYLKDNGILATIKHIKSRIRSIINFSFQVRYIFKKDLKITEENSNQVQITNDYNLLIISSNDQLQMLLRKGYIFNSLFDMQIFEKSLNEKQKAFCIFVKKKLVHYIWVVSNENVEIFPPININYKEEAYLWQGMTLPEYRRLGFYSYNMFKIIEFLKEKGTSAIIGTALTSNIPPVKKMINLDYKVCGKVYYLKIFSLEVWKEKRNLTTSKIKRINRKLQNKYRVLS